MADRPSKNTNDSPNRKQPPRTPLSRMPKGMLGWLMFFGMMMLLFLFLNQSMQRPSDVSVEQLKNWVAQGRVQKVTIHGNSIAGTLKPDKDQAKTTQFQVEVRPGLLDSPQFYQMVGLVDEQGHYIVETSFDTNRNVFTDLLLSTLPWLLFVGIAWFFLIRQLRMSGGGGGMLGNFGRSRHRVTTKEHTNITFGEVAGVEEAKEEVSEIVEFLRNPRKFQRLGGRIPRGVLLVGEPGCGKTLLAKAIAGEAEVPFFSISGSDFVEMFVGVGASRVRDLFRQAKENSPCIIFLDEIDAVGRKRGTGFNGAHDEREQTLNAILVEMDGFNSSDQVIVIAATNREDVLDPALTRPGRFDRRVYVPLPDVKGRLEILRVHARKVKMNPTVDMTRLARGTPMFSGAELAAIINEAAIIATMANKESVEMDDLEEARDKVRWGRARKSRAVDEKERSTTAYHEAGHTVVQLLVPEADPLHKVSIIPRGPYGGATFSLPEKDRTLYTKKYCLAMLRICFGGRVAEEMFCDDISSGAGADIRQATEIAKRMVTDWGMSDKVGFIYYGEDGRNRWLETGGNRDFSDETAHVIDSEIKALVDKAQADTRLILAENRDKLQAIADALLRYETLDADEIKRLMRGEALHKPTISDLIDEHAQPVRARPASSPPEPDGLGHGTLPQPN
jgi:cell division protease FtsH